MSDSKKTAQSGYGIVLDQKITRNGHKYRRVLAHTPWIKRGDDLSRIVTKALKSQLNGGTVFISEKVAIVTNGDMVRADSIKVSRFARFTSKFVRPTGEDLAQSIPERNQFVIDRIGMPRMLLACLAAALTRPFGVRGAFFVVAGSQARDLDGMHGEYMEWLLPPLKASEAKKIVEDLAAKVDAPVAIVDINDRGGHIRAVSGGGLAPKHLLNALLDNPHGHKDTSTPIGVVELLS